MDYINIEIICNRNYSVICRVMLYSLFYNNKDCRFNIFLLTDSSWKNEDSTSLEQFVSKFKSNLNVIKVDKEVFTGFPTSIFPIVTNFRLLVASILPDSVEKIIHLDVDTIVNGDIKQLWNTDISEYAIAAVKDCDNRYLKERLCIPSVSNYINAGVMLCNLKFWREHNVQDAFFDTFAKHKEVIKFPDQDIINITLYDKIKYLSPVYNLEVWGLSKDTWPTMDDDAQVGYRASLDNPVIIHYANIPKPWDIRYYFGFPYSRLWISYWWKSRQIKAVKFKPMYQYLILLVKLVTRIKLFSGMKKYFVEEFWKYY
ncbi:MAG: glycosyltransferase family 8 protein [Bacteroidaceae bacterium]|nr:glycosyltransferase family 8 protein [Bacteroidaceae bacterium]